MDNKNAKTGAVRSPDVDNFSYSSLPLLGLIGVARTSAEGLEKYGRMNYRRGMPVHQYIDHVMHHLVLDQLGDRSQPNLEHAAWGILAAIESRILHPELNEAHDLGPGMTITPAMLRYMDEQAPILSAGRKYRKEAGIELGNWRLSDLPDVVRLLEDRALQSVLKQEFPPIDDAGLDADLVEEMANFLANGEEPTVYEPIVLTGEDPADRLEFDRKVASGWDLTSGAYREIPASHITPEMERLMSEAVAIKKDVALAEHHADHGGSYAGHIPH